MSVRSRHVLFDHHAAEGIASSELIQRIRGRSLSVVQAAELLGLSRSQVHRLLQAFDQAGADGLVSKKRGGRTTGATARIFAIWCSTWCGSITWISDQRGVLA